MKRLGMIAAATVLLMWGGCATQQERNEQRARMRQAVEQAVASRQWRIDIQSMLTLRYGARTVTPDFYLELRGDTLVSYLPYLGQAHQATLTTPIGLNFKAPLLRYADRHLKPHVSQMEMDVKTQEDNYHYIIDVYDTGEADIRVSSLYRDPISFTGTVSDQP